MKRKSAIIAMIAGIAGILLVIGALQGENVSKSFWIAVAICAMQLCCSRSSQQTGKNRTEEESGMKRGSAISVGFSVGISMSILFSVIFCKTLENYAGIGVGICFGVALGVLTFVIFRVFQNKQQVKKKDSKNEGCVE